MTERPQTLLIACNTFEDRSRLRESLATDASRPYVIIQAESAVRAIELCHERLPNCLILDNSLPDVAGIDVVKRLTTEGLTVSCPTILLIGSGDAQLAVEAMKSGACDCLEKGRAKGEELRFAVSRAIEKAIENKLRESNEAQLRGILDHSTAVIFIKDLEGRYLRINHRYEALFGVTEAEVKGKTDYDLHAREIADAVRANDRKVITANRPIQFEEQVATADWRRDFISVKFPLYDEAGSLYGVCGIATDITERKRAEAALQESKERLQLALEAADVGTWRVDLMTNLDTRDAALNRIIGMPEQTLILPLSDWFDHIHPDDVLKARESWERSVRTGLYDEENRMVKPDGKVIWVRDRGRTFYDPAGEPLYSTGAAADITEHKHAEEALREGQALNQSVLNSLKAQIAVLDRQGIIIAVNEDWERFAHENAGTAIAGCVGVNYLDIWSGARVMNEDSVTAAIEGIHGVLNRSLNSFLLEYPCHSPDEKRWFLMSVMPQIGNRGGAVVTHNNITARKLAEEKLKEGEERLNLAMQAGETGMVDWFIRDDAILLSKKMVDIYGLPPDKTIAKYGDWRKRVYPEDLPVVEDRMWGTFERKLPNWLIEYRILRADTGEVRWIESRHRVFYDAQGKAVRTIGAVQDITGRKQAEETIRENQTRSRQIADSMPQIVYAGRPNGIPDYANQRWYEYTGAPAEQPIIDTWHDTIYPDDREQTFREWWKSVETGRNYEVEFRLRRKDGQYRWFLSRAIPIRDAQGRIIRWIGTKTDIHDRKQAESMREQLLVSEQSARETAEAANRSKDEFLALVSHELRSPLNAILGYAGLLRYGEMDAQKIEHAVSVIERSGKAQTQLIDDLMDTARIISGKLRLDVRPVDLVSVIEQAVQTVHPAADAKGISLQTKLPSDISPITGDPARMQQVIWNLLSNAIKFTPQGGRVLVRLESVDSHIRITVRDTGKGIAPDFLPYVFDRFRQADSSSARRHGGLGLGLALAKYLVELHGGTVEAASAGEGLGSTFTVTLPVRAITPPLASSS